MVRPAPSTAKLLALLATDEAKFVEKIRAALSKAGSFPGASAALDGVPERTLRRWADEFPAIIKGLDLPAAGRPATKKPDEPKKTAKKRRSE